MALAGAMLFGAFSAFWSMLAFRLETPPLHYGTRVAGLFGLIGVAGASAAPIAGRLADRLNPRVNVRVALFVATIAFVVFALFGHTLWGLVVGVVALDAGRSGRSRDEPIANSWPSARSAQSSDDGVHGGVLSWRCRWFC